MILKNDPVFTHSEFSEVSSDCVDFLQKTLVKDPKHRLSAPEALKHPWLALKDVGMTAVHTSSLSKVTKNLLEFSRSSSFQKMIFSIISSLKIQTDELREIKRIFNKIDINNDGELTIDELRESLTSLNLVELFADDKLEACTHGDSME